MQHPSGIPEKIVKKVVARRGRLHAFETIDPTTTALSRMNTMPKHVLVSDALAGHAHGLHEATLATFYRSFGDVRPSDDVIRLLGGPRDR